MIHSYLYTLRVVLASLVLPQQVGTGSLRVRKNDKPGTSKGLAYIFVKMLVAPLSQLQEASVSSQRIGQMLNMPVEERGGQLQAGAADAAALSFHAVSFRYSDHQETLTNISFTIPERSRTAFVGSSGCGKSTLFKLICGFIQPTTGAVVLKGHPLQEWDLEHARAQISLVSQDAFLFPGTIAENIAHGKQGASLREIIDAAKMANAHEFVSELKEGYQTYVGERGILLSGGQRQRITIARAFLKNAPLLLLDEPTSALDANSEALVQEALERIMRNRTVLFIAHRLSTIRNVDQIFAMHEGRIVEQGTHNSLMAQKGWYATLYSMQVEGENTDANRVRMLEGL